MPSLAELTDYDPSPVQPYSGPRLVVTPANVAPDTDQLPMDTRPEPRPEPLPALSEFNTSLGEKIDKVLNKLTGSDGEERYQLWPEKVIRSGLGAAGNALSGKVPQWSVDNDTGDVHTSPQMIEKAQDIAALAGTGGLAGTTDASLGSSPFLRPALKYEGKIYKAPINGQHLDALPEHLAETFNQQAMSGEDISNFNFGFMNHKGQFLDREKALDYAIKEGLLSPDDAKYGVLTSSTANRQQFIRDPYDENIYTKDKVASINKYVDEGKSLDEAETLVFGSPNSKYINGRGLTSQLLADSSKPGTAIEAMAKTGGIDPIHFRSPEAATFRLGQLQRDKASSKKNGVDVESSDYMHYNTQIRTLKNFIKNGSTNPNYKLVSVSGDPFKSDKK